MIFFTLRCFTVAFVYAVLFYLCSVSFRAHDHAIKCLAISDTEDMLVTGILKYERNLYDKIFK
jgi:hypothetical protein